MIIFEEKQIKKSVGFTLLELLVVVAAIALISSFIAISALAIRISGKDAGININMDSMRKAAATYRAIKGNYSDFCSDSQTLLLADDIDKLGGQSYSCQVQEASPEGASYCVKVQLNSGNWMCEDSSGAFERYGGNPVCGELQINKSCD